MSAASPLPLAGKRIVVTRARSQASSLVTALTDLGAEVIELPTIEIAPLESYDALDEALRNLARYEWLIVTSANTARVLGERLTALELHLGGCCGLRKVAIGSSTARTMLEQGMPADVVPKRYIAESLLESLGSEIWGGRVLLARAMVARDVIPEELTRRGAIVDVVDAYSTVIPEGAVNRVREVFSDTASLPDAITFTSSSTVKHFAMLWEEAGLGSRSEGLSASSIGPMTSATLREYGWEPAIEAIRHDVDGLVEATRSLFLEGSALDTNLIN